MTGTTPNYKLRYPEPADLLKDSNVQSKLANDIRDGLLDADAAIAKASETAEKNASWYRGAYPGGPLASHSQPGLYYVPNPSDVPDWPEYLSTVPCHVEFWVTGQFLKRIVITSIGARAGVWESFANASGEYTSKWRRTDTDFQRDFRAGEDVLAVDLPDGRYGVTSANMASLIGLPEGHVTIGYVKRYTMDFASGICFAYYMAYGKSGGLFFNRTLSAAGESHTWAGWIRIDTDGAESQENTESLGLNREILKENFTLRRGGRIGVMGKAAIALRFDDPINGLINSGVADALRRLQLPASAVHCADSFTAPDLIALSNLGSWQTVKDWAHNQGMEVWHHGGNHRDASHKADLTREIIASLTNLQKSLPTLEVNKWAQPGVGGTNYDGFATLDDPSLFYASTAGKLLAKYHAVISGPMNGQIRELDGNPRSGMGHWTVDKPANLAAAYGLISEAVESGAGLNIMLHPNNLDREGDYSTAADFVALLEHLSELRDQGKAEVLTMSGLLCSDAATKRRAQLIRNSKFENGFDRWLGTAGWSVSGGVAVTSGTTSLGQSHSLGRYGWSRGGTMQLKARVRAINGSVIKLGQYSNNEPETWDAWSEIDLPASPDWKTVRLNCCVPLTLAKDDAAWTRIARVSGGQVEVSSMEYSPV